MTKKNEATRRDFLKTSAVAAGALAGGLALPNTAHAAGDAKRNIFTEKPVGTDAPGIRKVLDAADIAKKSNLAVVAGTQRRHQKGYLETLKRVKDGEIGDLVGGRFYWNQGLLWKVDRKPE